MSHREIGVVIVGAGRAGLVHGKNFAAGVRGAELIGVVDPSEEARTKTATELEVDHHWASLSEAFAHPEVDAVVIATPTQAHADLATEALDAGKHVLLEKPLCGSLDEAERILAAERTSAAQLMMAFMRRFDDGFVRAEQAIRRGDIGQPIMVKSMSRGPGLPAPWAWDVDGAGGLIGEVNAHDLDAVRWLSAQEYRTVYAVGYAAKRPDIAEDHPGFIDVVATTFTMTDDVIAQVDGACPADYGYDARIEVYGSEGVVLAGDPRADTTLVVRAGSATAQPVASWRNVFANGYRAEDQHFVSVIRGLEEPRTSIVDGIRSLEAILAVNASIASGRVEEVVRSDLDRE